MYALRTWQTLFILATLAMPALGQAVDAATIDIDHFDTGVFEPVNGDQSVNVLRYLFGEIIDSLMFGIGFGGGDGGFLADMFRVLNVVILFFGAILFTYTAVVGIVSTAHDGEVLGRRWSSMWVPIRVVVGFGMLLPVASGYSLIQVIVLWATLSGIGLADALWSIGAETAETKQLLVPPPPADARQLAVAVLASEVCMQVLNKQPLLPDAFHTIARQTLQDRVSTVITWGDVGGVSNFNGVVKAGRSYSGRVCGALILMVPDILKDADFRLDDDGSTGSWWGFGQAATQEAERLRRLHEQMTAAHLAAVNRLIEEIQPLVTRIVDGQTDLEGCGAGASYHPDPDQPTPDALNVTCNQLLVKAADHYAEAVAQAALRVTNALSRNQWSDFIRTAKRDGWLLAGTWYYKLAQLSEHITEAVRNTPRVIPMEIEDRLATEHLDEVGPKLEKVKAYVSKQAWYGDLQAVGSPDPLDDPNGNFLQNIINQGFKYVLSWITTSWAGNGDAHPILEAKTLGDYIIGIGEALMVVLGAGSWFKVPAAVKIAGAVAGVSGLGTAMTTFLLIIAIALFIFGAMLSIFLPLLPYLIWIGAVLGWLLLVLEAVIAAPLWAMAHVNPEGEGAAGQAGQGYMLLLSLVLRPTLMIFGLFAAMLVSFVIMRIINVTFVTAVLNMQSESISGIVTLVGVVIIFTGLSISAITKSFSLIYWIPDNVLRWVGGHVERLSDFGVEGETRHTYDAGANQVSEAGQSGATEIPRAREREQQRQAQLQLVKGSRSRGEKQDGD